MVILLSEKHKANALSPIFLRVWGKRTSVIPVEEKNAFSPISETVYDREACITDAGICTIPEKGSSRFVTCTSVGEMIL